MNQKISLLESSIDFVKEKLKANEYNKSLLENRISAIQNRMLVMFNGTNKVEKQNLTNLDTALTNSHTFTSSLKKVDANVTANLRKLQQYFGGLIMQSETKFCEIQEKLIGMITQKEKILRNLNFQLQNQGHSIAAIEEWIKNDHHQANSLQLIEENLRQKIEYMQKNNEMKMQVMEEKMKYLEQLKETASGNIKNLSIFKEQISSTLQNLKKQTNGDIQNLKANLNDFERKIGGARGGAGQSRGNLQNLEEEIGNIRKKLSSFTNKIEDIVEKSDKITRKVANLQEKINVGTNKKINSPQDSYSNYQHQILERKKSAASENNNNYQSNSYGRKKTDQNVSKNLFNDNEKKSKKQIPPRRNLLQEQGITPHKDEEEFSNVQMRGGIRGLLQKSKQKDREGLLKTNDPLGRPNSLNRRGLPPVKQDPVALKKKNQPNNMRQKPEEQEAEVFQIDEQGYLLDEYGNYLQDENGAMIKLSPQEIKQYMMDEQQY